jgi:hypothetical protein
MNQWPPPFATQRILFFALFLGVTMFAIAAGILIQTRDGKGLADPPIVVLDDVVIIVGAFTLVGAFAMRALMHRRAARLDGQARGGAKFMATLLPLAMLEGGCLLGVVAWMLNGNAVPNLVVTLVLMSIAIALIPLRDPAEGER